MTRMMKDSGIEWIGEIPESWDMRRVKSSYKNHKDVVGRESFNYERLALTLNGVIKRNKEDTVGLQPENFDTYQILKTNELVFKLIDLQNVSTSRVGYSPFTGIVSPAYIILTPKNKVSSKFGEYYFKSMWQREIFNHIGDDGVRSSLNASDLLNIPYPTLEYSEQEKIAKFLDDKCGAIDEIISKTEQSIEEYKKLKQSVITKAVTKGIRPNRPMQDSNIEWIGEIPTDWNVRKIKDISNLFGRIGFRGYTTNDLVSEGEGAITLSPSNIFDDYSVHFDKCSYLSWFKYEESPEIQVNVGDIIFVKTGSSYGKSGLVSLLPECATINPQLIIFKNCKINNKLFLYILQSSYVQYQCQITVVGGTIPTMSQEKIKNFSIILPHSTEQKEIVAYLDEKCAEIDTLIEKKQQFLSEMANYKKSLIYEYVTGKKEVA